MKTINTVLPVYDRLIKQCYERSKHVCGDKEMIVPVITPQWKLPAMQWNVEDDDPGYITSIMMINEKNIETEIINYFINDFKISIGWGNWTNSGYDAFTPVDYQIFAATKTTAAGIAYAYSGSFSVTEYDTIVIKIEEALTSGTAPVVVIVDSAGNDISDAIRTEDGIHYYNLTVNTTDVAARIRLRNLDTELSQYTVAIDVGYTSVPYLYNELTNKYFYYNGNTIGAWENTLNSWQGYLPAGYHYLKITTINNYVYYSDWFLVDCVYDNLLTGFTNVDYTLFGAVGTQINIASNAAGGASAFSTNTFPVIKDETYTLIFYGNLTSDELPYFQLFDTIPISNTVQMTVGLNIMTFTATETSDMAYLKIYNTAASVFYTGEILLINSYSTKYLKLVFEHSCNLGEIIYEDGFTQTLFLEAETMEPVFPYTEKGQENGYGQFIPAFQRQEKNYLIKTLLIPQFIVDVLHRLKLHDSITLTDLVGDEWTVKGIDVEHEWQFSDKYYATATLTIDVGEEIVTTACCTDINECP